MILNFHKSDRYMTDKICISVTVKKRIVVVITKEKVTDVTDIFYLFIILD